MTSKKKPMILIVDDDGIELTNYFTALRDEGYLTQGAQSIADAWMVLENYPINMVLSDIHFSKDESLCEGLSFLKEVKDRYPHLILMAMSKDSTRNLADRAKAAGAWTFIKKPEVVDEEFFVHIRHGLDVGYMVEGSVSKPVEKPSDPLLRKRLQKKHPEGIILTEELRARIRLVLKNPKAPVIIEGETGTGKEEIVKHIHKLMRSDHEIPLVSINCAHLRGDLIQSTLFGHKKGAFTGAVENTIGALGRAHGGILFLDEFHRLPHEAQEHLLRTLQDGTYHRVGDHQEMRSNFRLFISTPKSIDEYALEGKLLMDIRFRLYGVDIRVPPLRERLDQMDDFIDLFFMKYDGPSVLEGKERQALISRCREFYWQGNIRQLFGTLEMLAINAQLSDGFMRAKDLPVQRTMLPPGESGENQARPDEFSKLLSHFFSKPSDYDGFMSKLEKMIIEKLVDQSASIKTLCEELGVPRSTFEAKRKRLETRVE